MAREERPAACCYCNIVFGRRAPSHIKEAKVNGVLVAFCHTPKDPATSCYFKHERAKEAAQELKLAVSLAKEVFGDENYRHN